MNDLRYADDITCMAEGKEELKSLLMKVKEESEKVGSKSTLSMGREVGGGFRMGETCTSMADSCQCLAKTTTIL